MTEETSILEEPATKKKKARDKRAWIWIIIIAVIVVFVALLLTVLIAPELNSLADLFNFIGKQF